MPRFHRFRPPRLFVALLLVAVSLAIGGHAVEAQQADATAPQAESLPAPQTHYLGREIAVTMHYDGASWLVRESRDRDDFDGVEGLDLVGVRSGSGNSWG